MKTLRIDDDTHAMIINKIDKLKEQYGISVTIESVVTSVLRLGIPEYKIERKLIREIKS